MLNLCFQFCLAMLCIKCFFESKMQVRRLVLEAKSNSVADTAICSEHRCHANNNISCGCLKLGSPRPLQDQSKREEFVSDSNHKLPILSGERHESHSCEAIQ